MHRPEPISAFVIAVAAQLGLITMLLAGLAVAAGMALSSSVLAFMSTRDRNADIFLLDVDRGLLLNFTHTPERGEFDPAWSPDGEWIAFAMLGEVGFDIRMMGVFGGDSRRLTDNNVTNILPAWSADGQRIAFSADRRGNPAMYVVNTDGAQVEPLTHDSTNEVFDRAAWSPDGRRIAYTSGLAGTSEIYVMDVDGSNLQALTENATADAMPAWSPDGQHIAFVSMRDGNSEIYVMNVDGTNPQRLTEDIYEDNSPAWSPDGRRIAFMSLRDGNAEIYVMNADGSDEQRLTWHDAEDSGPVWWPVGD